ncbi:heme NO-binding domain-containing protein [uncultured Sulfitobacter sp.]|uniref:heme NO-binding domain-containing protein n=1 Tax=uncultured Sulfitobacter sp. TaxID=191468 RepID=UPI002616197F|nr:heme NO-binding domain-containing protein [uncultured Sulfitobacter sp.]
MKGTIFVELVSMAEDAFGEDVVDLVLDKVDLKNDGAFTTVGNYPCSELIKIVMAFSEHSGISAEVLQRKFGHWMMDHFTENYAEFFTGKHDSFSLLEAVDGEIHVDVKKLYPDAELPVFETDRLADKHLKLTYSSPRPLVEFCHGMVEACLERYKETAAIERCPVSGRTNATLFDIRLNQ